MRQYRLFITSDAQYRISYYYKQKKKEELSINLAPLITTYAYPLGTRSQCAVSPVG